MNKGNNTSVLYVQIRHCFNSVCVEFSQRNDDSQMNTEILKQSLKRRNQISVQSH